MTDTPITNYDKNKQGQDTPGRSTDGINTDPNKSKSTESDQNRNKSGQSAGSNTSDSMGKQGKPQQ
ncbi:MAG TPA: hypothetical protein VFO76_07745 [Candidatus Kapabacteria bacterium]|nr:hypothetical protein [Candidatus Kapabacteria bacterium]